jgi:hypothetical protein
MSYRILKNAGLVPGEVQAMRDIEALRDQLKAAEGAEREELLRRIHDRQAVLNTKLEGMVHR